MSAQAGREMTLKIFDDQGTALSVDGLRAKTLRFYAEGLEATHMDSPDGWREYLVGAGARAARLEASGAFVNSAADALIRAHFFAQSLAQFEIFWPGFGTLAGSFLVTSLQYQGEFTGEARFEIELESGGAIQFAPV